jgi:hypothetical protein
MSSKALDFGAPPTHFFCTSQATVKGYQDMKLDNKKRPHGKPRYRWQDNISESQRKVHRYEAVHLASDKFLRT